MGFKNFFKLEKSKKVPFLVIYILGPLISYILNFLGPMSVVITMTIGIISRLVMVLFVPVLVLLFILDSIGLPIYSGGFFSARLSTVGWIVVVIIHLLWAYLLACIIAWIKNRKST
jgi:hypothetical protein